MRSFWRNSAGYSLHPPLWESFAWITLQNENAANRIFNPSLPHEGSLDDVLTAPL